MPAENTWQQDGNGAVEPRHAGPHRNEREHVEVARDQRLPAAHEERPAAPEHDRRRQQKLQPVRPGRADEHVKVGEMPAHLQHDHRQREREADPEPPRHVGELGVPRRFRGHQFGLERHPADRARAGAGLPNLRVHRAGIDRALGNGRQRFRRRLSEVFGRLGGELVAAPGGAEIVGAPAVLLAMRRLLRIDRHAADRVPHAVRYGCAARSGGRLTVGVMVVVFLVFLLLVLGHRRPAVTSRDARVETYTV